MDSVSSFNVHWVHELLLEDPSAFHNQDSVFLLPIESKIITYVTLV